MRSRFKWLFVACGRSPPHQELSQAALLTTLHDGLTRELLSCVYLIVYRLIQRHAFQACLVATPAPIVLRTTQSAVPMTGEKKTSGKQAYILNSILARA